MPREKYREIYVDLKEKIEQGDYKESDMIPSENILSKEYQCTRNTIRRAIRELIHRGYVQSVHGKGVQVIYHPIEQAHFTVGGIESFAESARRNKKKPGTAVMQFAELTVDDRMSRRTGFHEGAEVYYIQRVRSLDDVPLIYDINVFLKSETPGLNETIANSSIYKYLEDDLGMQITTSNRIITAELATPIDTKYLALDDYDFVCVITGRTFNSKGIQFEYTQSRHRPDYFSFQDTAVRTKYEDG
ncbi:MAG: trehalose operon repressor [Lachnospiraceae bacterium]|nr:trehalose operon repressor [Lachnospiraceae bacterium]